jgi:hypothetical protein
VKTAIEAAGSHLALILEDTGTTLPTAISGIEGGGGDATEAKQDLILAAVAALDVGTGSGANAVTITIDDGTNPLESVKVRVTKGSESYLGTTNASGVATFALDNGTWTVRATLPLYTMDAETLVVDGTEAETYSMTALSVTVSDEGLVTGYWLAHDADGVATEDVTVTVRPVSSGQTGTAHETSGRECESDANGMIYVANLKPGMRYEARRGTDKTWIQFDVATTATTPYALTDVWGRDEEAT